MIANIHNTSHYHSGSLYGGTFPLPQGSTLPPPGLISYETVIKYPNPEDIEIQFLLQFLDR